MLNNQHRLLCLEHTVQEEPLHSDKAEKGLYWFSV